MSEEIKQTPWFADKPFIGLILTPILILVGKKLGIEINATETIALVSAVVSFVVMSKWKGAQMAKAATARMEAEARIGEMGAVTNAIRAAIENPSSGITIEKIKQ
jgi:hypothetical protein